MNDEHPGLIVRRALAKKKMSQADLARASGLTPKHISQVLNGRSGIGTGAAQAIEDALGIPARKLIRAQADFDVANGRSRSRH